MASGFFLQECIIALGLTFFNVVNSAEVCQPPAFQVRPYDVYPENVTPDVKLPRTGYYRSEAIIHLPCQATGTPKPTYEWKLNGNPLDQNSRWVKLDEGNLTINPASMLSEGTYQCIATNKYGSIATDFLTLLKASLGTPSKETTVYTAAQGQYLKLDCNAPPSVPRPKYGWDIAEDEVDDNPREYTTDKRVNIDAEGNLHFAYVRTDDHYLNFVYKCRVFNKVLDSSTRGGYSRIQVTNNTSIAPVVKLAYHHPEGEIVTALQGNNITFRCLFSGKPEPDIFWSRDAEDMPDARIEKSQLRDHMTIRNLLPGDSGSYKCEGRRGASIDSHTFNLEVKALPKFIEKPHDVNVTQGGNVKLCCRAEADPLPTVNWAVNVKRTIQDMDNPRLKLVDDGHCVELTNAYKVSPAHSTDLMVLQCNASNMYGYQFAQGYINVLEPTVMKTKPKDVYLRMNKYEEVVKMECGAESDPSTPIIYTWYLNDERCNMNSTKFEQKGPILYIKVRNETKDIKELTGEYKCVASNGEVSDGYSSVESSAHLYPPEEVGPTVAGFPWWWLVLALIVFILIIICCWVCVWWMRTRGDVYDVDEKERAHGLYPEEELFETGYHEYQRPEAPSSRKPSRADSLSSTTMLEDGRSLGRGYSTDSLGRFTEDGSFIGQYSTTRRLINV